MRYHYAIILAVIIIFAAGCKKDDDGFFYIPPQTGGDLILVPDSLAIVMPNGLYSQTIAATGGSAPYSYSITWGTLPGTVALDENTGELSGTPGETGTFTFVVTATDSSTPALSGFRTYDLLVTDGAAGWTRASIDAVVTEASGWESGAVGFPCVIREGASDFKMWYSAADTVPQDYNEFLAAEVAIGHATSTDGINWTKEVSNPVLSKTGVATDPDGAFVGAACVIRHSGDYHMWYTGASLETVMTYDYKKPNICYATSSDGVTWSRHGAVITGVVDIGVIIIPPSFTVSAQLRYAPWVLWDGDANLFRMYFTSLVIVGSGSDPSEFETILAGAKSTIGYATSPDGTNWTVHSNAVVSSLATWEADGVATPCVIKDGSENCFKMWYTGSSATGNAIGFAKSFDGLSWIKSGLNPVFTAASAGWDSGSVVTPSVMRHNAIPCYKMWYTGSASTGAFLGQIGYATCPEVP